MDHIKAATALKELAIIKQIEDGPFDDALRLLRDFNRQREIDLIRSDYKNNSIDIDSVQEMALGDLLNKVDTK